jgi:hypothetical protein
LRFDVVGNRLEARATLKLLATPALSNIPTRGLRITIGEFDFDEIDLAALGLPACPIHSDLLDPVRGLAAYQRVMQHIAEICERLFPGSPQIFVDSASSYFSPSASADMTK